METKLTTKDKIAFTYVSNNNVKRARFVDGLYMVELYKLIYNKPIYVSTSVLDISKLTMMMIHYGAIHRNDKRTYNLIHSDADSLVYNIKHDKYTSE